MNKLSEPCNLVSGSASSIWLLVQSATKKIINSKERCFTADHQNPIVPHKIQEPISCSARNETDSSKTKPPRRVNASRAGRQPAGDHAIPGSALPHHRGPASAPRDCATAPFGEGAGGVGGGAVRRFVRHRRYRVVALWRRRGGEGPRRSRRGARRRRRRPGDGSWGAPLSFCCLERTNSKLGRETLFVSA